MGFENIFDGRFPLFGYEQVFLNIAQGINDGRLAFAFNIISRFAQAARINLLDVHGAKILLLGLTMNA